MKWNICEQSYLNNCQIEAFVLLKAAVFPFIPFNISCSLMVLLNSWHGTLWRKSNWRSRSMSNNSCVNQARPWCLPVPSCPIDCAIENYTMITWPTQCMARYMKIQLNAALHIIAGQTWHFLLHNFFSPTTEILTLSPGSVATAYESRLGGRVYSNSSRIH